ncbi:hypothetical protein JST97_38155 [bacterium]|nr:hypothetical protein [bacterium]
MPAKPRLIVNLFRLFMGFIFSLVGIQLYIESSWEGVGVSAFFAFLLVLGLRWGLLGMLGLVRALPPRKKSYGAALVGMIGLALIGPTLSTNYQKSNEPVAWKKVESSKDPVLWQMEYANKVALPFRRKEYRSRECEATCAAALAKNNFSVLRAQAQLAFVTSPNEYDDQCRKFISESWAKLQEEGLKKVKPTKLADPQLTEAFQQVLEILAANPTRKVQLHYTAQGGLDKLPEDKAFFANLEPKYQKLPIIPTGEAFGAESHKRRAGQVSAALRNSFNAVWPEGMMEISLASDSKETPGDVNFWVEAQVRRIKGFYTNSEDNKINALLYKCEVIWQFRITQDGREIGKFGFRSEPAKHVSYSTYKDDPDWAVYSIIMDSAADAFARLIIGRLGLTPPPLPEKYTFVK